MAKCRMCSQVIYGPRKICPDCEWEIESAQAVLEAAAVAGAQAQDGVDAEPQSMPSSDVAQSDASTSFNLWRTRRASRSTAVAVAAALALAAAAGLRPGQAPTRTSASVMDGVEADAARHPDGRRQAEQRTTRIAASH